MDLDLQAANDILEMRTQSLDDLNKEMLNQREVRDKEKAELDRVTENTNTLEQSLKQAVANESRLKQENLDCQRKIAQLESQSKLEGQQRENNEKDFKRYQDSISYLTREIDEQKLQNLDLQIVKEQVLSLQDDLALKDRQIKHMTDLYINKKTSHADA